GLQAGFEVQDHTPELWLTQEERSGCPIAFDKRKTIVVDPWARVESRRWRWERWEEVVHELRKRYRVVTAGKRIPDHVSRTRDLRPLPGEIDVTNRLSLRESAV